MNYFLVDYENVNVSGLNGITKLSDNDVVVIFYSDNADTLTFSLHKRLNETKAALQYQKVKAGVKNALDFQLSSYLGFLIRDNMKKDSSVEPSARDDSIEDADEDLYYVVSKDQGFAVLSEYWKRHKASVFQVADVAKNPVTPVSTQTEKTSVNTVPAEQPKAQNSGSDLENKLQQLLAKKEYVPIVLNIINHYQTKSSINVALIKQFDSERAGKIYRTIKPLIADRKGK